MFSRPLDDAVLVRGEAAADVAVGCVYAVLTAVEG